MISCLSVRLWFWVFSLLSVNHLNLTQKLNPECWIEDWSLFDLTDSILHLKTTVITVYFFPQIVCIGSFRWHTYVVWSKLSDFSVWSIPKWQVWNLPQIMVQTKQPNLGLTKRGGHGPDQIEPWVFFMSCVKAFFERFGLLYQWPKQKTNEANCNPNKMSWERI